MDEKRILEYMVQGQMIGEHETMADVAKRVFSELSEPGRNYGETEKEIKEFKDELTDLFLDRKVTLSTPIITNAGRHDRPLSACSVPPLNQGMSRNELENLVNQYHKKGMGTGFNFDESEDPVEELKLLNCYALKEFESGEVDRPVGNMGILSIDHPKVLEFIEIKSVLFNEDWKFNLSVNINEKFLESVNNNTLYKTSKGKHINANKLLDEIVRHAHFCGDPGLLFLERFEQYNITPHLGKYVSLAPCGEVPMANGEVCQFSYINLGAFVKDGEIDYSSMKNTVWKSVKLLDNALDITISKIENETSANIVSKKRKIGIGVCGFQDLLWDLGIPYDSEESYKLAEDLMSFINYNSKLASVDLAKKRGPFPAFYDSETRVDLITERFLDKNTNTIKAEDWYNLEGQILNYGIRHVSTNAIPPTGRSSVIIDASPSIEPTFSLAFTTKFVETYEKNLNKLRSNLAAEHYKNVEQTGSLQSSVVSDNIKKIYQTALEISPESHLYIVSAFQKYTDDSISKTVNLPSDCSPIDIKRIYLRAYDLGLKGITVYRDGCKNQPEKLKKGA